MSKFYANGLHFNCTSCGNCCKTPGGAVAISESEMKELSNFLKLEISDFINQYCISRNGKINLKEQEDTACIFLQDNRCTVYEARPIQCRTFPFWPENLKSPYRWKQVRSECPGIDQGDWHSMDRIQELMKLQKQRDKYS